MSRPLRLPHPQTTLHLYRHLLREASYLPLPARPFIDAQIKGNFHKHKDLDDRSKRRIKQAHHDLRYLRAANAGDIMRMRRVLLRAFGRIGRRRRELVANLVHREIPTNTEELQEYVVKASVIAAERREIDWLDSWDVDKLRTFARSQIQTCLANPPKAPITYTQTVPEKLIPAENSWGRPFVPKVARTKLKKVWKAVADKCMPPLPKEEWERLGRIADSKEPGPEWLPRPRRPVAQSALGGREDYTWNWQPYATKPISVVDRPARRRSKLLNGVVDDNTPTGDPQPVNYQKYTPRLLRRLFAEIWQLTSIIEKKPHGQGWNVTWGKLSFDVPPATARTAEFFDHTPTGAVPSAEGGEQTQ
ncbi:LYR motif-containing protein Cup1-like N-terminal domain-containing protein [Madurella fahalii]|uniref:LYR motif-containing protein Cup1-like N-terminal domain-containing protein n=1 Tax=Madurella fahalii TaxID=1157608 RepID=A0ABQ0GKT9_9PEZI